MEKTTSDLPDDVRRHLKDAAQPDAAPCWLPGSVGAFVSDGAEDSLNRELIRGAYQDHLDGKFGRS